jgi:hypothetical protein
VANDEPEAPRKTRLRVHTAWHPLIVTLIEHILPHDWYRCISEYQLTREPLRVDIVIVRRSREGNPPPLRLLTSILGDLAHDTLVHFKGPSDELERDDARMLLAYALHYLVVEKIDDPKQVALRVVAARMTPRFVEALRSHGCALVETAEGVHEGKLGEFPIRVVETVRVFDRRGEHLLYTVTPAMVADPGGLPAFSAEEFEVFWALQDHVEQLRHPVPGQRKRHMKDESKVIESFDQVVARVLARLSPEQRLAGLAPEQVLKAYAPEQRLAGLAPEQRLAGLAPEQRLAGLNEDQAVLALPEALLRGLSDEYLATLPADTREAIRERLQGTSQHRSPPQRKPRRPSRG